jgi:hypothetical protein
MPHVVSIRAPPRPRRMRMHCSERFGIIRPSLGHRAGSRERIRGATSCVAVAQSERMNAVSRTVPLLI